MELIPRPYVFRQNYVGSEIRRRALELNQTANEPNYTGHNEIVIKQPSSATLSR